jgi:hypothetical protein
MFTARMFGANIFALLLLVSAASAICSKGCPDVKGTDLQNSKIHIHMVPTTLLYTQLFNSMNPDKTYKTLLCPVAFTAPNKMIGEIAFSSVMAYRNKTTNDVSSFAYSFVYNKTIKAFEFTDPAYSTFFTAKIIYVDLPYFVTYSCQPLNPSDPENCFYYWVVQSFTRHVEKRKLRKVIKTIEAKGLDVGKSTMFYPPSDCIWKDMQEDWSEEN